MRNTFKPATISLCMIVKNEGDVLERCLKSVTAKKLVDEIIIVDTGSCDNTKDIAALYTENVYDFEWIDDFSAARNYSFSKATCDFCMWLDADDIFTHQDAESLLQFKRCSLTADVSVVMMPYNTGFDSSGNVTFSYYRERIIRNNSKMYWVGAVHEVIQPIGSVVYHDAAVTHKKLHPSDPDRNLRIFETQIKNGVTLEPREQFYYARELYYHKRFTDALIVFQRFLEEPNAWLENKIDACCHCAYCYSELNQPEKALQSLLNTFALDLPRAEVCCEVARHFFERECWSIAAFWYTIATTCKRDDKRGGFTSPDSYDYLPCIQLCVCYSKMNKLDKAVRFNEMAAVFKPDSEAVKHNRLYFASVINVDQ